MASETSTSVADLESELLRLWKKLLNRQDFGIDDDFKSPVRRVAAMFGPDRPVLAIASHACSVNERLSALNGAAACTRGGSVLMMGRLQSPGVKLRAISFRTRWFASKRLCRSLRRSPWQRRCAPPQDCASGFQPSLGIHRP